MRREKTGIKERRFSREKQRQQSDPALSQKQFEDQRIKKPTIIAVAGLKKY